MTTRTSTLRAREIGYQLRCYRVDAGMTQYYAAQKIGISTASMCRIEDGTKPATAEDVAALLAIYNVTGPQRDILIALAREVNERGWLQRYSRVKALGLNTVVSLEPRASTITTYQVDIMPGLLQTPEYVDALFRRRATRPEKEIRANIKTRLTRRHILFRDEPVQLVAFIGELALRRAYGSAAVHHRQLDYLLKLMERPNIVIRVVPCDGMDFPTVGSFHMMHFPASPTTVHTFSLGCELYLEDQEEIALYDDAVHELRQSALDTGESARLISRLMTNLEDDPDVLPKIDWPPLDEDE